MKYATRRGSHSYLKLIIYVFMLKNPNMYIFFLCTERNKYKENHIMAVENII